MLETLEKLVMQVVDLTFEQFVEERAARKAPENQEPDTLQSLRRQADATRTAFYRLVGFLRDIIKLRAGLAAGEIPRFARPRMPRDPVADADPDEDKDAPPPAPRVLDPRMKPVAAYLVAAVRAAPRNRVKPDIHQKIPVRLQQAIHADPGFTLTGAEIAVQLCKEFRLPYNIAKLSRDPHPFAKPGQATAPHTPAHRPAVRAALQPTASPP